MTTVMRYAPHRMHAEPLHMAINLAAAVGSFFVQLAGSFYTREYCFFHVRMVLKTQVTIDVPVPPHLVGDPLL